MNDSLVDKTSIFGSVMIYWILFIMALSVVDTYSMTAFTAIFFCVYFVFGLWLSLVAAKNIWED